MRYDYSEAKKDKEKIFEQLVKIEEALDKSNTIVKNLTNNFSAEGKFAESLKLYLEEVNMEFVSNMKKFIKLYKKEYNTLLNKAKSEVDTSSNAILYENNIKKIKNAHMNYSIEISDLVNDYNKSCRNVSKYISSNTKHINNDSSQALDKMISKMKDFSEYDSTKSVDRDYWNMRKFTNQMNKISLNGYQYNAGDMDSFMKQYLKEEDTELNKDALNVFDNMLNVGSLIAEAREYPFLDRFGALGFGFSVAGVLTDIQSGNKNIGGAIFNNIGPYAASGFLAAITGASSGVFSPAVAYTHNEMYNKSYTYKNISDHGLDLIGNADYGSYYKSMKQMKDAGYIYSNKDGYFVKSK